MNGYSKTVIIQDLEPMLNGLGIYAPPMQRTTEEAWKTCGNKMLQKLHDIENQIKMSTDAQILYLIGAAFENYTAWYQRGDSRKIYLEKAIEYLEKSLTLEPNNCKCKIRLGMLLIDQKIVRNLNRGIQLLNDVDKCAESSTYYYKTSLEKAKRWNGDIPLKLNYDLRELSVAPAALLEERKKFKILIKKFQKENNLELLKKTLSQYYSLAFLATLLYEGHKLNLGVSGEMYENAIRIQDEYSKQVNFSFEKDGYIKNCSFISKSDWKIFVRVFGAINKFVIPHELIKKSIF
jgi:tetratricopeptide (TPR) repeat protein